MYHSLIIVITDKINKETVVLCICTSYQPLVSSLKKEIPIHDHNKNMIDTTNIPIERQRFGTEPCLIRIAVGTSAINQQKTIAKMSDIFHFSVNVFVTYGGRVPF